MFNLKWCGIAGGFGLLLSLLVGIVSGAGLFWALVRALVFGAVFFILAGGIRFLADRFLPDLLSGVEGGGLSGTPGARVDISVGDGEEDTALPSALPDDSLIDGEPGDIADLLNGNIARTPPAGPGPSLRAMDQKGEDGYTENREPEFQSKAPAGAAGAGSGGRTADTGPGDFRPSEVLPDLDSMAETFRPGAVPEPVSGGQSSFDGPAGSPGGSPGGSLGRSKGQSMAGDFNPKDLASAIQTILSKD
jgi:hypothetical protein